MNRGSRPEPVADLHDVKARLREIQILLDRFTRRDYSDIEDRHSLRRLSADVIREAAKTMSELAAELAEWRKYGGDT